MSIAKPIEQIHPRTGVIVKEYPSIRAAGKAVKVHKERIREVLGTEKTIRGFKWKAKTYKYNTGANILLLDIETAPSEAYIWGLWNQDIYTHQIMSDWYIISWAAKWLFDEEVLSDRLTGQESLIGDDSRILENLWELLDQSDIVIGHNLDKFDLPRIKTRFLIHGIEPPSFYKQIDTLKVAKKEFDFSSNKLDYLAKLLDVQVKNGVDFELWRKCREGIEEALVELEEYNQQDVKVLEDVYLKLRPYIKGHPNMDLYVDQETPVCPNCGSNNLRIEAGKFAYTQAVRYQMYRCGNCFTISRAKKGTPFNHKKQISAIPR